MATAVPPPPKSFHTPLSLGPSLDPQVFRCTSHPTVTSAPTTLTGTFNNVNHQFAFRSIPSKMLVAFMILLYLHYFIEQSSCRKSISRGRCSSVIQLLFITCAAEARTTQLLFIGYWLLGWL